jgi:DNA-binding LacI/PurR family transcriptional regulator
MNTPRGALALPQRISLSSQAAASIRTAIGDRVWNEFLPSERRLCELFQVSRPTVRSALRQLAQEGLIEIRHGRRNRLLGPAAGAAAPRSRLVVLVTHQPLNATTLTAYQGISDLRAQLAEHGFAMETLVCSARGAGARRRKLETFLRQNRVLCCVLLSVGRELQEWFAAHSIPALVLGSCHASVRLPSLDVDYRAVCRHAVGVLRARGHRRIAFLVPDAGAAGDLVSEEGFRAGFAPPGADAEGLVVRHLGTPAHLAARLDELLAGPRPPTALLVAKPAHTLAVVLHLLRRGRRVPDEIALLSRDHDPLFEGVLAHYRFGPENFSHRLSRLMLQMVNQGHVAPEPHLILPDFVPGGTVRQPP